MSRRSEITGAAITVLATQGMRGLTHRAVDRAAGLSEGSTSAYYRTRDALLSATVERLAELDLHEIPRTPTSGEGNVVRAAATLLHHWLTRDRHRQLARYELTLEAARRPNLRAALHSSGALIRAQVAGQLAALAVPDAHRKANDLVACLDGLLFDELVGAGPSRDAAALENAVSALIAGFGIPATV